MIGLMTAFVISDVEGLDPELVARYRELARASIERYGGVYLTGVGNTVERVEGDWTPTNIVLVQFPSMQRVHEWYASPDYAPALVVRRTALRRNLIFVAGVDEP
jgi:uncharacterized protein (DUF1330 family)